MAAVYSAKVFHLRTIRIGLGPVCEECFFARARKQRDVKSLDKLRNSCRSQAPVQDRYDAIFLVRGAIPGYRPSTLGNFLS